MGVIWRGHRVKNLAALFVREEMGGNRLFEVPSKPFRLLYAAYILSTFCDQLWSFAIIFMLENLGGMRLVGISQLIENSLRMMGSAFVGEWMNRQCRLYATLTVLAINNLAVAASATLLMVCMGVVDTHPYIYVACLSLSILFGAVSKMASEGEEMSFTKDWIVVMSQVEGGRNAAMTIIGHLTAVVTPPLTAYIIVYCGYVKACITFIACNAVSWQIERVMFSKLYNNVKELQVHNPADDDDEDDDVVEGVEVDDGKNCKDQHIPHRHVSTVSRPGTLRRSKLCRWARHMRRTYWKQSVYPAAIALALMYMTVLGFDGIPISYGKTNGLPDDLLGWFKGAASLLGIAGALLYTTLERHFGVKSTGIMGMTLQQILNLFCLVSIFLAGSVFSPIAYLNEFSIGSWSNNFLSTFTIERHQNHTTTPRPYPEPMRGIDWDAFTAQGRPMYSVIIFFFGITIARVGVWITDLSITQIMQENIPEEERLAVFGIESSVCQFFSVVKDIIVIVMPDPRMFGILIIMSVLFVFAAYLHFIYYCAKTKVKGARSYAAPSHEMDKLSPEGHESIAP